MDFSVAAGLLSGFVLLGSAAGKLTDLVWFINVVRSFRIVPKGFETFAAIVILASEVLLSGMLLLGYWQPFAGISAATLLLLFTVAVAVNLFRGRSDLACGCVGRRFSGAISWPGLVRTAGLILLCWLSTAPVVSALAFGIASALFLLPMILTLGLHKVGSLRTDVTPQRLQT